MEAAVNKPPYNSDSDPQTPAGFWKVDAYTNGFEIIITGNPSSLTENHPLAHNCDEQGCGREHIILRIPILAAVPELIEKMMDENQLWELRKENHAGGNQQRPG